MAARDRNTVDPQGPDSPVPERASSSADAFLETTLGASEALPLDAHDALSADSLESLFRPLAAPLQAEPEESARPGDLVGRFRLLSVLGSGGFGMVFRAADTQLGRQVAVKLLRAARTLEPAQAERHRRLFRREAELAARLQHPGIVTLYDHGTWKNTPYLVMELLEGETLHQRLKRPLARADALRLFRNVTAALAYAHAEGVIHRDLKPANVFITRDGRTKLLDLGLAGALGFDPSEAFGDTDADAQSPTPGPNASQARTPQPTTHAGLSTWVAGAGTPAYMAPEQWRREPQDARVDVYALGVLLHQMLWGELPPRASSERAALPVSAESLRRRLPRASPKLCALVARALAPRREDRPNDAGAVHSELLALMVPRVARRRALLSIIVVSLVAAGGGLALRDRREPARPAQPTLRHRQLTFRGDVSWPTMSPDGKLLAYVADKAVWLAGLGRQGHAAGPPRKVLSGGFFGGLRFSATGDELLAFEWDAQAAQLHFVPTGPGAPHAVPKTGNLAQSYWAGGGQVVSAGSASKLATVHARDGRVVSQLALPGKFDWLLDLDAHPTLPLLAYLTEAGGRHVLSVLDARGEAATTVLTTDAQLTSPRWAEGGTALLLMRIRGAVSEILRIPYTAATATHGVAQTLISGIQTGHVLSVSADGKRILYTREPSFSNLLTFRREDPAARFSQAGVALTRGTAIAHSPALSPDGLRVVFSIGERPSANLYLSDFEGGEPVALTTEGWNSRPAFSPDGRRLLFTRAAPDARTDLTLLDLDSRTLTPLPIPSADPSPDAEVGWAPLSNPFYRLPDRRRHAEIELPSLKERDLYPALGGYVFSARPAPSGEQIALFINAGPSGALWLINRRTGARRALKQGHYLPVGWTPDEKAIWALEAAEVMPTPKLVRLWRLPMDGQPAIQVLQFPKDRTITEAVLSHDGRRLVATATERKADVWMGELIEQEVSR